MHSKNERQHVIDFIFPVALFFVFAASSLVVILLAASVYQKTSAAADSHYELRTSLNYVAEKIRQSDTSDAVSTGTFDGRECLIIRQDYGSLSYVTYIYEDNGILRELFLQDGVTASAGDGTAILPVRAFHVTEPEEGFFEITCTAADGTPGFSCVSVRSQKGGRFNAS